MEGSKTGFEEFVKDWCHRVDELMLKPSATSVQIDFSEPNRIAFAAAWWHEYLSDSALIPPPSVMEDQFYRLEGGDRGVAVMDNALHVWKACGWDL